MCDSNKSCVIPILRENVDIVVTDNCSATQGGTVMPSVPDYVMKVTNPDE